MSIYNLLNFDNSFDKTKFGDSFDLSDGTKRFLSYQKLTLTDDQINDIKNNVTADYYINPLKSELTTIKLVIQNIQEKSNSNSINFINAANAANILFQYCYIAANTIDTFTIHTNRLSGTVASNNTSLYPDLDHAYAVGSSILSVVNKTDNIDDNSPILGSMTSLFITDDINTNIEILNADYITLNASIYIVNSNSFISNTEVNSIKSNIESFVTLLTNRRDKDIAFYRNALDINKRIQQTQQRYNSSGLKKKLISLIGNSSPTPNTPQPSVQYESTPII